jgi:hypothetical protein
MRVPVHREVVSGLARIYRRQNDENWKNHEKAVREQVLEHFLELFHCTGNRRVS